MGHYRSFWVICFFMGVCQPLAWGQVRGCGDVVAFRSAVGQAVEIVVEDGVGDLVRSGDPTTIKVEHAAGHLFVTPLTAAPAEVTIIDARGRSHRLQHIFDQGLDKKVVIGACPKEAFFEKESLTISLMRGLILGKLPAGATERLSEAVMLDNGQLRLKGVKVYELPQVLGYDMVLENLTNGPVVVPVQQITLGGLLAVHADKDVLGPGEASGVHMVVRR